MKSNFRSTTTILPVVNRYTDLSVKITNNKQTLINNTTMDKNKTTPLLHKDKKNEQNIKNQDYPGEPNSKPDTPEEPTKEDPSKIPESNDPAGYSEDGNIKESPSGQREAN